MANHVKCSRCGKAVSREVEVDLVVRAFVECPECVGKQPDWKAEAERLKEWQRQMVEKAADKSLDGYRELGAKCATLEKERDQWHGLCKDMHNERQELRGILGVPIPLDGGTVAQEFDPQYQLLESARMIVKERDEALAKIKALEEENGKLRGELFKCHLWKP